MRYELNQVRMFMEYGGQKLPEKPEVANSETRLLRFHLINEELQEYREACANEDLEGILDALCDLTYVVFGAAEAHGMGEIFEEAFWRVHHSNMEKFPNGVVTKAENGKVIKPDDWEAPQFSDLLEVG